MYLTPDISPTTPPGRLSAKRIEAHLCDAVKKPLLWRGTGSLPAHLLPKGERSRLTAGPKMNYYAQKSGTNRDIPASNQGQRSSISRPKQSA